MESLGKEHVMRRSGAKMSSLNRLVATSFLALATVALGQNSGPQQGTGLRHWVTSWSTAVHAPLPFPGLPPSPVFENQTIRMVIRSTVGGDRLRIRFSNDYGTRPLAIGSAHVAITRQGGSIVPESDHALTFGGQTSVDIPPGSPMLSDPVDLKVEGFMELSVSVYLPKKSQASSVHSWAQHETYISNAGDFTARREIENSAVTTSWYWLSDLEVWTSSDTNTVVAFGDSITDGVGAKQGDYADWPDMLADQLNAGRKSSHIAVTNEGIGGNRVLWDGAGSSALARFDRDVLAQPGVKCLIVLEGINDIGWPHMRLPPTKEGAQSIVSPFAQQAVTSRELITGLQQLIERAHEHGICVVGATLTPFEGADYYSIDGEATRQAVNQWIRTGGAFDAFVDFDAAVRDPSNPAQFREGYHSGDHLHPSAIGYKAMAEAVDIGVLKAALSNAPSAK
jgi:lysophospholipase L1-like esterase